MMRWIQMAILTLLTTSLLTGIPQGHAENGQVNSSDDDAHEYGNGTFSTTSNDADIYSHTDSGSINYRCAGFRFENIPVRQGEQLENAYIELYIAALHDMNALIYAHDTDDSTDFVTLSAIIDNAQRPKTDNYVEWIENGLTLNAWDNSENIAGMIQEVVDRPGWEKGNDITILIIAKNDQNLTASARTYDFNPVNAANLHFHWDPTIENTRYPEWVAPKNAFSIRQNLESHGQGFTAVTCTLQFKRNGDNISSFKFTENTPDNDTTPGDCAGGEHVYAEWFVAAPHIEDNYTFYTTWEFIHEDYHILESDNYTIEVCYPELLPPETRGNPGVPSNEDTATPLSLLACGIGLIAVAITLRNG